MSPSNPVSAVLDRGKLRRTFSTFATGVTVVTTVDEHGRPRGLTANSFTSVSLEPPLVLVCIGEHSSNYELFRRASHFAVNILSDGQRQLSNHFASRSEDKFAGIAWHAGVTDSPLLEEVSAKLECVTERCLVVGDHLLLIGKVVDHEYTPATPLLFYQGAYLDAALSQAIIPDLQQKVLVGAIIEDEGKLLFVREPSGRFALPLASQPTQAEKIRNLLLYLEGFGIRAHLNFVYSLFDDEAGNRVVYYRGRLVDKTEESPRIHWFAFSDIPWDRLESETIRAMIECYALEQRQYDQAL